MRGTAVMRVVMAAAVLAPVLVVFMVVGGCAAPRPISGGRVLVADGGYAGAFEATRRALIGMGFDLERIDARRGVITTRPKATAGLATPWHGEQSNLGDEVADLVHSQHRVVRVEFVQAERAGRMASDTARTQIQGDGQIGQIDPGGQVLVTVSVLLERVYRPGWRPQAVDVLRSGRAVDPALAARAGGSSFAVAFARDAGLENRLTGLIAAEMGRAETGRDQSVSR